MELDDEEAADDGLLVWSLYVTLLEKRRARVGVVCQEEIVLEEEVQENIDSLPEEVGRPARLLFLITPDVPYNLSGATCSSHEQLRKNKRTD